MNLCSHGTEAGRLLIRMKSRGRRSIKTRSPCWDDTKELQIRLVQCRTVYNKLHTYLQEEKWYQELNLPQDMQIAYFSMEFGLAEALPVYSGGLGVLAGDHLKSASDMGIPLIGIGLLYRQGYFRQRLNADGWQMEEYPENDWYNMSVTLEMQENGEPHLITVIMGDQTVYAHIWRVQVGSVQLLLLDTNFPRLLARQITTSFVRRGSRGVCGEFLLGGRAWALKTPGMNPDVT